jgi:Spy/CpxP family protein refolding chaperone
MTKKQRLFQLLLLFAMGSSFLMAQNPPPFPPDPAEMVQHRVQHLTTILSLTSAQQTQALAVFTKTETSLRSVPERMHAAHDDLQIAIKNNDVAGIEQAANAIGNLTKEVTVDHATGNAAFYQILTADQQAKFAELEGGDRVGFMAMGPGLSVHTYHAGK